MIFKKACYSLSALNECVDVVKKLPLTIGQKQHEYMCYGPLLNAYDFCFDKTKCLLFESEYSPWKDYANAVKAKMSKKYKDMLYKNAVRFLQRELNGIKTMIMTGEIDCVD